MVPARGAPTAGGEGGREIATKETGGLMEELCAPDVVSPAQFHELWSGTSERGAAFKLALAVLEQAVEDLQRHRDAVAAERQRLYVQARRWVSSNDRRWPYSFMNVCDMLNLSCGRVRTKLLELDAAVPLDVVRAADVDDPRDHEVLEEELQRSTRA